MLRALRTTAKKVGEDTLNEWKERHKIKERMGSKGTNRLKARAQLLCGPCLPRTHCGHHEDWYMQSSCQEGAVL